MAAILVIDDRESDRQFLTKLLDGRGHTIIEGEDGAQGLEQAAIHRPDLIITDIVMPNMDGYEFLRRLRQDAVLKTTPVVVYTATYFEEAARALADRCGVFSVVQRSTGAEELLKIIDDALRSAPPSYAVPDDQFGIEHRRVLSDKLAQKVAELEAEIERRQATEASLLASESRLLLAMEASGLTIWDWNIDSGEAIVAAGLQKDGRPVAKVIENAYSNFSKHLHPDDRERVTKELEQAHQHRREFQIEYRMLYRGLYYKHMETRGRFLYDAGGQADRAIGTSIDVSERVRSEQERRLQAALVDNSVELIGVVQEDGKVTFVNPAGLKLLGVTGDLAKDTAEIFGYIFGEDASLVRDSVLPTVLKAGSWRGEVRFLNQVSGEPIPCECSAFAIHDAVGTLQHIALIAQNISERKRSQALLENRVSQLLALRNIEMAISGAVDLRLTLNVIVNEVQSTQGVVATCIYLFDPDVQEVEVSSASGFFAGPDGAQNCDAYQPLAERAAKGRKKIAVGAGFKVESSGPSELVPLMSKGAVKGVLAVVYHPNVVPEERAAQFIEALAGQAANAIEHSMLFEDLQRSKNELTIAYDETIEGWSRALDLRDKETEGHSRRVTELTMRIARVMRVPSNQLQHIRRGALLHDIGKVGVPDSILLKPGPLSDDEWKVMRMHTVYAFNLLAPIEFLRPAMDIPYCHHEKWDGTGYPRRLRGEQIPLSARIFAVADVWDAIRSDRPYRAAWSHDTAIKHIASLSGTHFDPQVVDRFLELVASDLGRAGGAPELVEEEGQSGKRRMG